MPLNLNFLWAKPNNIGDLIHLAEEVKQAVACNKISYDQVEPYLKELFDQYCQTHTFSQQDAVQLLCTFMKVKRFAGKSNEQKLDLILTGKLEPKYRENLERSVVFPVDIYLLHLVAAKFQTTFYMAKPKVDPAVIRHQLEAKLQQERDQLFYDKANAEMQLIQEAERQQLRLELDEARARAKREMLDSELKKRALILQKEQAREQLALVDQQQMERLREQQALLEQQETNLVFNREYMRQAQEQTLAVYRQQYPNVAERFAQQLEVLNGQIAVTQQELLRNQQHLFQVVQVGFSQISAEVQTAEKHILNKIDQAKQSIVRELKIPLSEQIAKWQQNQLENNDITQKLSDYVPLSVKAGFANTDSHDLHQRMLMFLNGKRNTLLLLGDCGTGKTLYAYYLERQLWQAFTQHQKIPIVIQLGKCRLPNTSLVEDYLQQKGFNVSEIADLKKGYQFVIIFDGYDEGETLDNLYLTNQLYLWQAKVIYTSRGDYNIMNQVEYQKSFSPERKARADEDPLEEWIITPLSEEKSISYLKRFLQVNKQVTFTLNMFMQCVSNYPELKPLLACPLSLQIMLDVINPRQFYLEQFLDDYTEAWFKHHETKLFAQGKSSRMLADIRAEYRYFARKVALVLYHLRSNEIALPVARDRYFLSGKVDDSPSPWQPFFNADKNKGLIRLGCPLRQVGINRYVFLSPLLLNYFADRLLVDHPRPDPVDSVTEALCQQGMQHELEKNLVKAFACYLPAAQKNYFRAQTNVATFYLLGLGGAPCDKDKAYRMFLRAARQGHQRAQFNLAKMREHGDGKSVDVLEAIYWYSQAAQQGDIHAKEALKRLEEKTTLVAAPCK